MRYSRLKMPFALLSAGILALSACESATEPEENHAEDVEGVILVLSGQTIASYDGGTGAWTGELEVEPGEETAHITVRFVDDNGAAVQLGDDFYLRVEVEDESIAEFEQDTPGEFGGHLHGQAEGDTEITFSLMHGSVGSGHADFVTQPLHIHVHEH
ncbi:MAG: hypothetical protein F4139_16275 [Gemmatimonadetes bacterium]|nr:hypothetical protein [Gemmatimonadota bacterium]MYA65227.1 hypothetical protein [Gemmatimonadota bacterium]MYB99159.1 hypothetical protein [Gemmatimonadota bacterium]MYH54472.1 hypothetical protein [Gemmatimonadota bacterium]MYI46565.1 hypothetical protein [Gemmatimonadota bacterium]